MNKIMFLIVTFLILLLNISCVTDYYVQDPVIESEYQMATSIPRENIKFSPLRYKGKRGQVYILVQVQPTDLSANPEIDTVHLYNQTMRNILQNECAQHFRNVDVLSLIHI